MSQSILTIKMEENLKKQFEDLCNSSEMTMNTAFNLFARIAVRERRIPSEICEENKELIREELFAAIEEIRLQDIKDGAADMSLEEINAGIAKTRRGE